MLRPKYLRLKNFMSYVGEHQFRYIKGVTMIQGVNYDESPPGSIGTGKTALAGYAATWCIFGTLPVDGFKADDVINRYEGHPTAVYWHLEDKEFKLEVTRTRTKKGSSLEVFINGEVPMGFPADLGARDKWLQDWLRIDYALWNSTVFLSPGSKYKSFFDSRPADRMQTIASVYNDAIFQEAAKKLTPKINLLEREVLLLEGQKQVLETTIASYRRELEILEENMQNESDRVRNATEIVKRDTEALEYEILRLQDQMRKGPGTDRTQIQISLGDISRNIQELSREFGALDNRLRNLPNFSSPICPTCNQAITAVHVHNVQSIAEQCTERKIQIQRTLSGLEEQRNAAQLAYAEHEAWPAQQAAIQGQMESLRLRAYAAREGIDNSLVMQYQNQYNVLEAKITHYVGELEMVNQTAINHRNEAMKLEVIRAGFRTEIRYMMVDAFRDLIDFYANQDLQVLGRDGWSLKFASEKGEKETFIIEPQYLGERMELPSKGQRHKFSLATTSGLIKALYHQRPHRIGMLILDDPVGDLDDNGQREVGAMLEDLAETFCCILLTVPTSRADFGSLPVVTVNYRNSESKIER